MDGNSKMVERMAKAMIEADIETFGYEAGARAALEALRAPEEDMIDAGSKVANPHGKPAVDALHVWQSMIDKALEVGFWFP